MKKLLIRLSEFVICASLLIYIRKVFEQMTKEQAINYLQSSGFSDEQIRTIEGAFSGWGTHIPASVTA